MTRQYLPLLLLAVLLVSLLLFEACGTIGTSCNAITGTCQSVSEEDSATLEPWLAAETMPSINITAG